jgi:alginate O-acetyltransferase complex protein AlgI
VRYTDISRELKERRPNMEQITQGVKLFLLGLGSKVLIANNVGSLWTQVETGGFELISTPLAWLAVLAFSFQIYFDFSGYSLMAIGLGKMLGFDFPPNFNYPYISRSMTEFWRRWHMTLGAWFREYLYIPLGGNRLDTGRTVFNLFVVWAATGLWHGASWNFVLWGLYFFALIALERLWLGRLLARSAWLSYLYMIPLILVSWAIFAVPDFSKLGLLFSRMFVFAPGQDWRYYLRSYFVTLALAAVLSTPALRRVYRRMESLPALSILFFAGILLVSTAYLVDASYNPFLYFRF